jgi:hypothetical protein
MIIAARGKILRNVVKLFLIVSIVALTVTLISARKAGAVEQQMQTFLDTEIPGMKIQVNATSQTQPGSSLTVSVNLVTQTNVSVDKFNLEIFGFINDSIRTSLANITDSYFRLNSDSRTHSAVVQVPEQIWGIAYAELKISYSADIGGIELTFPSMTTGFTLTTIENTYLENLETQAKNLNETNYQLSQKISNLTSDFNQLNNTYWELQGNYTLLQGNAGELDNTRRLTAVLGIVAVFFVATTVYLVVRRPRESW